MSKQASSVLGIQFDVWEGIEKELEISRESVNYSNGKIEKIIGAGFITRLKCLFTGVQVNTLN